MLEAVSCLEGIAHIKQTYLCTGFVVRSQPISMKKSSAVNGKMLHAHTAPLVITSTLATLLTYTVDSQQSHKEYKYDAADKQQD